MEMGLQITFLICVENIMWETFKQNDNLKSDYSFGKDGNESPWLCYQLNYICPLLLTIDVYICAVLCCP